MNNPFHDHNEGPLPHDKFGCRTDLLREIEALTWARQLSSETFFWIIEGIRGFGKTSFANWCVETSRNSKSKAQVLVCNLDLLKNFPSGKEFTATTALSKCEELIEKEILRRRSGLGKGLAFLKNEVSHMALDSNSELVPVKDKRPDDLHISYEDFFDSLIKKVFESNIAAVVFIFDEVSTAKNKVAYGTDGASPVSIFCSEFSQCLRQHQFPKTGPNFGVILLGLPGLVDSIAHDVGPIRHLRRDPIRLEPFERGDLRIWIQNLADQAGCTLSPDFIDELYRYSGGIPDLVQAYGTGAWKAAIKRYASKIQLTGSDIHPNGRIHHTLIDSKATAAKNSFLGDLSAKLGAAETAILKEIGRAEPKAATQKSLEQWITLSHARLTKAEWNRDAAKRALAILVDCGILILDGPNGAYNNGPRYSFRSEGIRLSFAR